MWVKLPFKMIEINPIWSDMGNSTQIISILYCFKRCFSASDKQDRIFKGSCEAAQNASF